MWHRYGSSYRSRTDKCRTPTPADSYHWPTAIFSLSAGENHTFILPFLSE